MTYHFSVNTGHDDDIVRLDRLLRILQKTAKQNPFLLHYLKSISDHEGELTVLLNPNIKNEIKTNVIYEYFRKAWEEENEVCLVVEYR